MEKVKLTREQANAIEYALQEVDEYKGNPDRLLRHASMNNVNFRNELHLLDTIDIVTLAKALYIGYEVEPEFKVGDWVIFTDEPEDEPIFGRINKNMIVEWDDDVTNNYDEIQKLYKEGHLRHATPEEIAEEKERRWWAKHGRDVWELRKGDVLYDSIEEEALVFEKYDQDLDDEVAHFTNGLWEPMRNVKRRLRVVSFAEQRLDREGE